VVLAPSPFFVRENTIVIMIYNDIYIYMIKTSSGKLEPRTSIICSSAFAAALSSAIAILQCPRPWQKLCSRTG
jgi:hypothetical protein